MFLNSTLTSRGMCVLHTLDTLSRRLPCPSGGGGMRTALRSKAVGSCDCSLDMVRSRSTGGGRRPEASRRRPSSAPPSGSPEPSGESAMIVPGKPGDQIGFLLALIAARRLLNRQRRDLTVNRGANLSIRCSGKTRQAGAPKHVNLRPATATYYTGDLQLRRGCSSASVPFAASASKSSAADRCLLALNSVRGS